MSVGWAPFHRTQCPAVPLLRPATACRFDAIAQTRKHARSAQCSYATQYTVHTVPHSARRWRGRLAGGGGTDGTESNAPGAFMSPVARRGELVRRLDPVVVCWLAIWRGTKPMQLAEQTVVSAAPGARSRSSSGPHGRSTSIHHSA